MNRLVRGALARLLVAIGIVASAPGSAVAAPTNWKEMDFRQFVETHSDARDQPLAETYRAAGVKSLSYMVGQGAYVAGWRDPVELYLLDFKRWCVARDGVLAEFSPYHPPADSVLPPPEMQLAIELLLKDLAARFKTPRPVTALVWYECRGPQPAIVLHYKTNGVQTLPGDQQHNALFLYSTVDWYAFLSRCVTAEKERVEHEKEELAKTRQKEIEIAKVANAARAQRTRALRANPKIGDSTNHGMIVEVKPPLVLVQRKTGVRQPATTEWVKIERIEAP